VEGNSDCSWLIRMLGSVGGVFSASEFRMLGFEVGFCLEESDLGRNFLRDGDEMVPEKRVSALLLCLMVMVSQSKQII